MAELVLALAVVPVAAVAAWRGVGALVARAGWPRIDWSGPWTAPPAPVDLTAVFRPIVATARAISALGRSLAEAWQEATRA